MEEKKRLPIPREEPINWNPRPGEHHDNHPVNLSQLTETLDVSVTITVSKNNRDFAGHLFHCIMNPKKGRRGEGYGDTLEEAISRAHWDVEIDGVKNSRYNS